ncbi:N-acetylmuramoyl-L-alanine amidase [Kineococcus sp. R86509]|uniref:N-acetylmuramoyl-L-alanine amidase n=1 Tax=Kineococcus sp. R86509 TaxID=3093851 RepID=UPI0036D236B3
MPSPLPVSRRTTLLGVGGALAVLAVPAVPTPARAASPAGGVTSLALSDVAGPARALLTSGGLRTVRVPLDGIHGASMLGVSFPAGTRATSVSLRVTRAGVVGPWIDLALGDSAPDPGSAEPEVVASDPVWTGELGPGAVVEVRLPAEDAGHARLEVVDPGPAATSRTAVTLASSTGPGVRSRAEWGADESLRRGEVEYSATIRAAVVHHTADGGDYSASQVPSVIRGMYRYHTQTLGWNDLGYNVVVDRFGGIWEGRAGGTTRPVVGAHAGGFNADTFGVSMMGDFTSKAPSDACLQSVAAVIAWKFALHDLDADAPARLTSAGGGTARYPAGETVSLRTINGHRDVGYTACPGDVGYTRMDDVRGRVAALLAGGSKAAGSPIARKYGDVGGRSLLGAPTSDEGDALRGGRFRHYEEGSILFRPGLGAFVVRGTHRAKFASIGWEWSPLGFPTMDTTDFAGGSGSVTHFENGSIYRRAGAGPHVVRGAIRQTWAAMGWETSPLGFPTSDEYGVPGGRASDFEGGRLRWNASTGRVRVG